MTQPLLTIENLHTELDTEQGVLRAISGLSMALARGETFALVGESGCGKSMTAQTILRLLPDNAGVSQGNLWLAPRQAAANLATDTEQEAEQDLLDLPESAMRRLRGARIGMIFQEPNTSLNPVMTVGAQVLESLHQHTPLRGEAAQQKAIDWLTQVGLPNPAEKMAAYPFQLSGGQRQRVMIAIALAGEPDLLIADEPTTALDVTTQAQILQLLEKLQRERGMAMLLITHDLGIVAQMAHQVALMYAGEIVEIAERDAFFAHPKHPYAQALFAALPNLARRQHALAAIPGSVPALTQSFKGCRFANRCPQVRPLCQTRIPNLLSGEPDAQNDQSHAVRCFLHDPSRSLTPLTLPASRHLNTEQAKPSPQTGNHPLLTLRDVSVSYPPAGNALAGLPFRRTQKPSAHLAVKKVSLTLYPGQTLALVGESGCGKTTVAKAVLRLLDGRAKIEGQILLKGQSILTRGGEATLRRAVQIVFQDPFSSLNPRMRIGEILREGLQAIRPDWNAAQRALRIQTLLKQVGLPNDAFDRYPHEFSGGQRQRIAIARALAAEPQLIICDEPTSALDVSVQAQVLNLLKELQQTLGVAYLFITHNLSVVEYLADEVAVMQAGEIVEQGPAEQVLRQPQQAYTQQLLAAIPPLPSLHLEPS